MLKVIAKLKAPINTFVRNGKEETFFKPVGSMVELDNGKTMLLLDKAFNLLAIQHKENAGSVPIYMDYEEAIQAPVRPNKTRSAEKEQVVKKKCKTRPSKAQIQAALSILDVDARAKQNDKMRLQNKGKDGKHIDLPFDDTLEF